MELKKYIYPLRRWWWLILSATLVAALSSFLVTLQQPPVYRATTTLMIGRVFEDPNPTATQFYLSQQLAATYADIANRETVRNATQAALKLNRLPVYEARALNNSQLIEIAVTDTNPKRAQVVANELARQLILESPTSVRPDEASRQEFITTQLDQLQAQMDATSEQIKEYQADLGNTVSARQIADIQNQISALQDKYTTLQSNYGTLYANTNRGAVNTLDVIEPAAEPTRPIGPNRVASTLVAALIGFVLAAVAAYLLEYLDDTVKTPDDIARELGPIPVLGYIAELENEKVEQPFIAYHPRHPISEAFRTLRANLEFAGVDRPVKTLLITSTDKGEGKSSVAGNLAVSLAQNDQRVILIDADLRQPSVHEIMSLPNDTGLSDVFRGRLTLQNVMRVWKKNDKVAVVTGGSPPPNPAELLGSKKMDVILAGLSEVSDQIIVDGPPFVVSDAAILSSKVDGVLIVISPGYTRKDSLKAMMDSIRRSGANVVGVVLNRIPANLADYYAGQLYASYYSDSGYFEGGDGPSGGAGGRKRKWSEGSMGKAQSLLGGFRNRKGSHPNVAKSVFHAVEGPKQDKE